MGSKQKRIEELEAQVEELMKNELKILAEWSNSIGKVRMFIPPAVPMSDPADKKIIENQKATILELNNRVDELGRNCDGWKCSVRHLAKDNIALVDEKRQLKDELAELKAKPSMPFPPDSYKIASLEKEIRSLNLYITRLEGNLSDVRKLVN